MATFTVREDKTVFVNGGLVKFAAGEISTGCEPTISVLRKCHGVTEKSEAPKPYSKKSKQA